MSGEYESLGRHVTTFEDGYDSKIWRLTAGADTQITVRGWQWNQYIEYRSNPECSSLQDHNQPGRDLHLSHLHDMPYQSPDIIQCKFSMQILKIPSKSANN
jgi:hypothetical protein